jgi:hypothetical protein
MSYPGVDHRLLPVDISRLDGESYLPADAARQTVFPLADLENPGFKRPSLRVRPILLQTFLDRSINPLEDFCEVPLQSRRFLRCQCLQLAGDLSLPASTCSQGLPARLMVLRLSSCEALKQLPRGHYVVIGLIDIVRLG